MAMVGLLMAICLWAPAYAEDMKASVKVSGGGMYDYVVVGGVSGAQDGFDNIYDTVSPGPSPNGTFIFTSIPHSDWGAVKGDFRADIRSAETNQEWTMTVTTNITEGTPFTVSLDGENSVVPEGYTLSVTDTETGEVVTLDGATSYEFAAPADGTVKELRIEALYDHPVTEEPAATEEEPAATEETSQSPTETDGTVVQDETQEAQTGSSIDGTFYLAEDGYSQAVVKRPARSVPPAPAIREYAPSNAGMGSGNSSVDPRRSGMTSFAGDTDQYKQKGLPVICMHVIDYPDASVIYCGAKISREEILRRAFGGDLTKYKSALASGDSGNNSDSMIGQLINGIKQGLDAWGTLPTAGNRTPGKSGLLGPKRWNFLE